MTRNQKPEKILQKNKEEMTKEAKRAVLKEGFRHRHGITEFKDMVVDELSRPMKP